MSIRTFTVEQLAELGLPFDLATPDNADKYPHAAVELHREQVDSRRWVSVHDLVFRAPDDGKVYRVRYERGLTEHQDDIPPFGYDSTAVTAVEVRQHPVTVMEWCAAGEEPAPAPRRVLDGDEYDTAYTAARRAVGYANLPPGAARQIGDAIAGALATVGVLCPPFDPDPDTCTAMSADHDGQWWQCEDDPGHDGSVHDCGDYAWTDAAPDAIPPHTE